MTTTLNLDLTKVPREDRKRVKDEVGEFVLNESLRLISQGKSPVKGESFPKLSEEYAKREKGGNTKPNLELEGDLLNAFEFKANPDNSIEIGIFDSSEVPKADGHNNFSGDSKLPKRRFIPKGDQEYTESIQKGIRDIINENEATQVAFRRSRAAIDNDVNNLSSFLSPTGVDAIIGALFGES